MHTPESFFSLGLQKGFAGETEFKSTNRAGFSLQTSHFEEAGDIYHDEWAADRTGGGQELIKIGEQIYTRVYAGGTISYDALQDLGISKKEVIEFLISCLNKFGELTRFNQDCGPYEEGDWTYAYRVVEQKENIPITTGKEEIKYKGKIVFIHMFVICPVE